MRKIAVVTGTRAEYGILHPVMRSIEDAPNLKLLLVTTGMHMRREFGYTLNEIKRDGFSVAVKVPLHSKGDTVAAMAESVGAGIIGMTHVWQRLCPDIILVLGDRVEPFAAAVAGAYMNIPVAHIHGGDTCEGGNIDDSNRHAITKFSHVHFPASEKSAERIISMGEEQWRVHRVGSPALDAILNEPLIPAEQLAEKFKLDLSQPLLLVVQHPVTLQVERAADQIRETLEAVAESGYPCVLIYPNSDAGGLSMIKVIKQYEKYPSIKTFKSLPRKEYLSLMKCAGVIVGNSSSGIIDAPSLGIAAVNIGIRQAGRERSRNIIDVEHDKHEIAKAIKKAINDRQFIEEVKKCESPYGDGRAAPRITKILGEIEITQQLLQKRITY